MASKFSAEADKVVTRSRKDYLLILLVNLGSS
jgi:hypothetical protein